MNMPTENHAPDGRETGRLMDQLVDGELPDRERRELLVRLELEPDGWRRCALAFLEAQCCREALRPDTNSALTRGATSVAVAPATGRKSKLPRRAANLAALAAGLLAAFTLGRLSHSRPVDVAPTAARPNVEKSGTPIVAESPAPNLADSPSAPGAPSTWLGSAIQQWEQQGYHADTQRRMVSMELNDGRRLDVPVHEVRLQFVGDRTY
jgi:hypothetical protein